jgi:DnaJ like chaperone protein
MRDVQQSLMIVVLLCFTLGYWIVSAVIRRAGGIRCPKSFHNARSGTDGSDTGPRGDRDDPKMAQNSRPFECRYRDLLGVSAAASGQEIKAAYRVQLSMYHPDKVAHLGGEFYDLATCRTKEIIQAYEYLKD